MGFDKAKMVIEGEPIRQRLIGVLCEVASPVLEVGPGNWGLVAVREEPAGGGPLVAVAAGWTALRELEHMGPVIVLACDLPLLDLALVRFLAEWASAGSVVPVVAGQPQPLCARWSAADLEVAVALVASGERSMRALWTRVDVALVDEGDWGRFTTATAFADVDFPADLERLRAALDSRCRAVRLAIATRCPCISRGRGLCC